jgi:hypothetical protein
MGMLNSKKLKQKIHRWFIPSKANNHHPHLIRIPGLVVIAILILTVQVTFNFALTGKISVLGLSSNIDENSIVKLTNKERIKAGLTPLNSNSVLNNAARQKAYDMLARNYWSHYAPDGTSPWSFFSKSGYKYNYAGENLARNFSTSAGVMSGWMASQGHKENILNPKYSDLGVAVVNGKMDGKDTTLVVAMYAQPADSANIAHAASANEVEQPSSNANVAGSQTKANELAPESKNFSFLDTLLSANSSLNWGAKIITFIFLVLVVVLINTHRVRRKINTAHHPLTTIVPTVLIILVMAILIATSFGNIG